MRFILAAIAFLSLSAAALAQHHPFTERLVAVSKCDPNANVSTRYPGYVPGYYPASRYYWGDVYGTRFYQPPVTTANPTLNVDFKNVTNKVMSEIEWGLIANGRLVAEAKDVGTFSPGAEIKHQYGLSRNVFPLQTGLPRCIVLHVAFADGTHLVNPALPERRRQIYMLRSGASPMP